MYTFDSRVRYSEVGEDGRITLNSILDYMQDCTNFQSEELGVGLEHHKKNKTAWLLNSWQIIIDSYPRMGEKITVGTQSAGYEKMFGHRNFLITDEQGNRVAIGNSLWVFMDMEKSRPIRVPAEEGDVYGRFEPLDMPYASRKIAVPEGGEAGKPITVEEYHLDTNHHVNNGQYVRLSMIAAHAEAHVRELRVEYKKQALMGDVMIPVVIRQEKQIFVLLKDEAGSTYSVVQLMY